MLAVQVTTSSAVVLPPGCYDFISVTNVSDTTVYLAYDGDPAALTTTNGEPLEPGAKLLLADGRSGMFNNGLRAIHGGSGNKEIRVQSRKRGN